MAPLVETHVDSTPDGKKFVVSAAVFAVCVCDLIDMCG